MRNKNRFNIIACCVMAAALICLTACGEEEVVEDTYDPYAGKVQVLYGSEGYVWTDLQEGVPVSTFETEEFVTDGQYVTYTGSDYEIMMGIDVSQHQTEIDWQAAADSGVEFAIIRAGYRGSTEGDLYVDEYFHQNMQGAIDAGLDVGVYFFSQATTQAEAVSEAHYLLKIMADYQENITMPVVFDWEETGMVDARTANMTGTQMTKCAVAFCEIIAEAGFEPGVYFNRTMGYYQYDLASLSPYTLWFAAPGEFPDFYYEHTMWQYSFNGQIDGIPTDVDLNLYFIPNATEN